MGKRKAKDLTTKGAAESRTRQSILRALKVHGPQDAASLAEPMALSTMAVRLHLYALQEEGRVTFVEQSRPRGRPAKIWQLTEQAAPFFPDGHAELTCGLLNAMRESFGTQGLEKIIDARSQQQAVCYAKTVRPTASLRRRLEALAKLRSSEGYMAAVERSEDGSYLFIENHCPICSAAQTCQSLCAGELDVFRAVLGNDVSVDREEHIVAGDRRCVYRVAAKHG